MLACQTEEQGSAGESLLQVDEYPSIIVPLKETCPWLVEIVEETEIEVVLEEQIEEEESMLRIIEEKPIFNDVPSMPDNWYWRDKPLHKNTIKQGQKYWVDQGRLYYEIEICWERGMNCTDTCCKQTYCAPEIGDCIYYKRSDFSELYVCVLVMMLIVVGIPTCIKTMEILIMFRFCKDHDPDENSYTGGTTICECCTKVCACIYLKEWMKRRANKKRAMEDGQEEEEGELDEFEEAEQSKDMKRVNRNQQKSKESKNCCVVCCKAVFCCKTNKQVDKEVEMRELRVKQSGLSTWVAEEEKLLDNDALLSNGGEAEVGSGSEQIGFGESERKLKGAGTLNPDDKEITPGGLEVDGENDQEQE